jgi:hypothetical protein
VARNASPAEGRERDEGSLELLTVALAMLALLYLALA